MYKIISNSCSVALTWLLIQLSIGVASAETEYGTWTLNQDRWCWIKTSNWQNSLEAFYSDDDFIDGRTRGLRFKGNRLFGGTVGWSKCEFYAVGKKQFYLDHVTTTIMNYN